MKPYLTREYAIANDVFDPTPWEEGIGDDYVIARCPICGEPIYYDDEDVLVLDGHEDKPMHENCALFRAKSLDWFCDVLGIDLLKSTAKEIHEG